ncbi:MAG: hypothetical protein KatS3mg051_0253 [Anaerolineae bacterium]|nr:MAG: hypothetical protein KatS3mg051_0253 [Anaerolineae bacterium]
MSQGEPTSQVNELLRQGIEAARAGQRAVARALLEQVVQQDERNEKGWFWLAAVTDDPHEKQICLGNVLVINPDNERARRLLQQLEESAGLVPPPEEERESAGPGRTTVYLAIGTGVAAIVLLIAVIAIVLSSKGGDESDVPSGQRPQSPAVAAVTPTSEMPAALLPTATPSPAPASPTAPPPTWTPAPSKTPAPAVPPTLFPPPPATLPGQIIMRSGNVPADPVNQPIVLIQPDGSAARTITPPNTRGHAPALSPNGNEYAYIMYAVGTREYILQLDNLQGTDPRPASVYWTGKPTLIEQDMPAWSPDGRALAFVARSLDSATPDLYYLQVIDRQGDPAQLQRLTNDDTIESWPAFSPDGSRIVYVADMSRMAPANPVDLRALDLNTRQIFPITTNSAALIEAAPDWSPDGQTIVFQGKASGSQHFDIYQVPATGGTPELLITSDADDIQPRFSPDGSYLVFSSNRSGNWDVYVFELATQTIYQVTSGAQTDVANDWGP